MDLTGQILKQLRDEKEAIDTTIATLEELLRKQDRASRQKTENADKRGDRASAARAGRAD